MREGERKETHTEKKHAIPWQPMYPENPQNLDTRWMNSHRIAHVQYTEMVGFRLLMTCVVA